MDFEGLRYLLVVADQGSFTRAAIRLNVTQPAVSRRIQRLEEDFGTALLYRHGRGVSLTEAGGRVRDAAREALERLAAIKDECRLGGAMKGSVVLGLPPSLGASLSVPLARNFQARFPEARLRIVEGFSGTLFEWLEGGRIDIGVLYDARRSPTMSVTPVLEEELFLVERPGTGAPGAPASIADLADGPFALANSSNGLRRVIDAAVARMGAVVDVRTEVDSLAALKMVVEEGPERTVLPWGAVRREVQDGRLVARPFTEPDMRALLVVATPLRQQVTRLTCETERLLFEGVGAAVRSGVLAGSLLRR